MTTVEKVLLARAAADEENQLNAAEASLLGAGGGALMGVVAGQPVHMLGNGINRAKELLATQQDLNKTLSNKYKTILKPGPRMAGGLVGAILGGALGFGTRMMFTNESEAGRLLGAMQTRQLTESDTRKLAALLGDTYSNQSQYL